MKDIESFNSLFDILFFNLDSQCGIINILAQYVLLVSIWEGDPFDITHVHLLFNDLVESFPNMDKKDNCISLPNTIDVHQNLYPLEQKLNKVDKQS